MARAERKKRRGDATRAVGRGALAVLLTAAALPAAVTTPAHGSQGQALGTTQLISAAADGSAADGSSHAPVISANGEVAAFTSEATNLVPDDTNRAEDVFVRHLRHGTIQRVEAPWGCRLHDPTLSGDGRYLAYAQYDVADGETHVIVRDLRTGNTERADVGLDAGHTGGETPSLSADGRTVAFVARDADPSTWGPPAVYVRDLRARRTERVSDTATPGSHNKALQPSLSADGTKVAYQWHVQATPDQDWGDVYVHDRATGGTTQADATHDGSPADGASQNPLLSDDGSTVLFQSRATNMMPDDTPHGVTPFVRRLGTGEFTRIDPGPLPALEPLVPEDISTDGSKALLRASPYTEKDATYIRDLRTGVNVLVSPDKDGKPARALHARMDARAQTVVFAGYASFLPGGNDGRQHIFVRTVR
ncbi:TolB family protein [Streptomyces buecherae]|uniref:PD40 domain-containing protein n=1 Tax=Streptomyces buecherae TaxID=2763006 RepID=A0A7H8N2P2_9ACTN|nr:PD40 domain-containing protein [Streptomyces buecherae]QKW48611.1 PD40 domain-containing protein [Streptomyces buecherae]